MSNSQRFSAMYFVHMASCREPGRKEQISSLGRRKWRHKSHKN